MRPWFPNPKQERETVYLNGQRLYQNSKGKCTKNTEKKLNYEVLCFLRSVGLCELTQTMAKDSRTTVFTSSNWTNRLEQDLNQDTSDQGLHCLQAVFRHIKR